MFCQVVLSILVFESALMASQLSVCSLDEKSRFLLSLQDYKAMHVIPLHSLPMSGVIYEEAGNDDWAEGGVYSTKGSPMHIE